MHFPWSSSAVAPTYSISSLSVQPTQNPSLSFCVHCIGEYNTWFSLDLWVGALQKGRPVRSDSWSSRDVPTTEWISAAAFLSTSGLLRRRAIAHSMVLVDVSVPACSKLWAYACCRKQKRLS